MLPFLCSKILYTTTNCYIPLLDEHISELDGLEEFFFFFLFDPLDLLKTHDESLCPLSPTLPPQEHQSNTHIFCFRPDGTLEYIDETLNYHDAISRLYSGEFWLAFGDSMDIGGQSWKDGVKNETEGWR